MILFTKFGIPIGVLALIAAMRWFNVKSSGEPFFPGVEGDGKRYGKDGGAGTVMPATPGLEGGVEEARGVTSVSYAGDTTSDISSGSGSSDASGTRTRILGSALREQLGGTPRTSPLLQPGSFFNTPAPTYYNPRTVLQPSSPTPYTNPPASTVGGGGSKTYAI